METLTRRRPGSVTLIIAATTIVAMGVGVAILGTPDVTTYSPGTPEATAQAYVQALFDDDGAAAYALLDTELQEDCEPFHLAGDGWLRGGTARFTDVRTSGNRTTIDVRITSTHADFEPFEPFPVGTDEIDSRLVLESTAGGWSIVQADWPLYGCPSR